MRTFAILILIFCLSFISLAQASPIVKTPEAASGGLFQAWKTKNKKAAQKFAQTKAVNKLFSTRWRTMKFQGCTKREAEDGGGYECIYEDAKIDLSIALIVKSFRGSYKITELSFSSEAV